ncbi:MAG TPA: NAD(P)/FAD-dependent oxidoreductase [Deltaproteobacteria bacterium]|nr:NAD(P)/FAD-dependent oxidoreductase [Deltaproteobacteria bacterium]
MGEVFPLRDRAGSPFDVMVCGAGLAGLTLARQLRRAHPDLDILVVDRLTRPLPIATHKVGESSVELGSRYLEDIGLREYLVEHHLFKFGLRFFPGGGSLPLQQRAELGPAQEPIVPSYQIDRGRFENDLRRMIEEDGVTLLEGVKVGAIDLRPGDEPHEVELQRLPGSGGAGGPDREGGERTRVRCRWLVDASGRASLLRKRLKLTRGTRHAANASWFRVAGKLDITQLVDPEEREWHDAQWAPHRWRSTNHFMGPGYWAWVIPLSSGNTSLGVVVHDSHFPFEQVRNLENTLSFLEENEPILHRAITAPGSPHAILDFGCLKGYSHNVARSWSADRWAIVGEAGAFVDPFYSPGTDFIAYANSFTGEMIRLDLEGGHDLVNRARELSALYRSLVGGGVDLYRDAAPVYGHSDALLAKVYWDNFSYWSYPCQLYMQGLYRLSGEAMAGLVPLGERFAALTKHMQRLFSAWAEWTPAPSRPGFRGMPGFPSVLIDAHLALQNEWNPEETLAYVRMRLEQAEEIAGELLLRVMDEVGAERVDALVERVGAADWGIRIAEERVAATGTIGLARRRALRPLARDVERTLGRPPGNLDAATIRRVLGPIVEATPGSEAPATGRPTAATGPVEGPRP